MRTALPRNRLKIIVKLFFTCSAKSVLMQSVLKGNFHLSPFWPARPHPLSKIAAFSFFGVLFSFNRWVWGLFIDCTWFCVFFFSSLDWSWGGTSFYTQKNTLKLNWSVCWQWDDARRHPDTHKQKARTVPTAVCIGHMSDKPPPRPGQTETT